MSGFEVDPDALLNAAEGVSGATDLIKQQDVSAIDPSSDHIGDANLAGAWSDFTERWQVGIQNLIKDGDEFAQRLGDTYKAYTGVDAQEAESIRAIGAGQ